MKNEMKVFAFTGHRPDKINKGTGSHKYNKYDEFTPEVERVKAWLKLHITRIINDYPNVTFIAGGALGVDTWAAEIVEATRNQLNAKHVKLHLYLPCVDHYEKWPQEAKDRAIFHINHLCDHAVFCYPGRYPGPWVLQKRNEAMVDEANGVIAVWDETSGGTANCVDYAVKQGLPILGYNPSAQKQFRIV